MTSAPRDARSLRVLKKRTSLVTLTVLARPTVRRTRRTVNRERRGLTSAQVVRPGGADCRVDVAEALREVLREQIGELACLDVVLLGVTPGGARVEQLRLDAGHLDRHLEPEDLVCPEGHVVELAGERGAQHRARRLDGH